MQVHASTQSNSAHSGHEPLHLLNPLPCVLPTPRGLGPLHGLSGTSECSRPLPCAAHNPGPLLPFPHRRADLNGEARSRGRQPRGGGHFCNSTVSWLLTWECSVHCYVCPSHLRLQMGPTPPPPSFGGGQGLGRASFRVAARREQAQWVGWLREVFKGEETEPPASPPARVRRLCSAPMEHSHPRPPTRPPLFTLWLPRVP